MRIYVLYIFIFFISALSRTCTWYEAVDASAPACNVPAGVYLDAGKPRPCPAGHACAGLEAEPVLCDGGLVVSHDRGACIASVGCGRLVRDGQEMLCPPGSLCNNGEAVSSSEAHVAGLCTLPPPPTVLPLVRTRSFGEMLVRGTGVSGNTVTFVYNPTSVAGEWTPLTTQHPVQTTHVASLGGGAGRAGVVWAGGAGQVFADGAPATEVVTGSEGCAVTGLGDAVALVCEDYSNVYGMDVVLPRFRPGTVQFNDGFIAGEVDGRLSLYHLTNTQEPLDTVEASLHTLGSSGTWIYAVDDTVTVKLGTSDARTFAPACTPTSLTAAPGGASFAVACATQAIIYNLYGEPLLATPLAPADLLTWLHDTALVLARNNTSSDGTAQLTLLLLTHGTEVPVVTSTTLSDATDLTDQPPEPVRTRPSVLWQTPLGTVQALAAAQDGSILAAFGESAAGRWEHCPPGTRALPTPRPRAFSCVACSDDYPCYLGQEVVVCPTGTHQVGNLCTVSAGYFSPSPYLPAQPCPAGRACYGGAHAPLRCPPGTAAQVTHCVVEPGYYAVEGKFTPGGDVRACPAGHTCAGGEAQPDACTGADYQDEKGMTQCKTCDAGYRLEVVEGAHVGCEQCTDEDGLNSFGSGATTTCTDCPANTHATANHDGCLPDPGYYAKTAGADGAFPCPAGFACPEGEAVACTGAEYQDEEGKTECKTCGATEEAEKAVYLHTPSSCEFCPTDTPFYLTNGTCTPCTQPSTASLYCVLEHDEGSNKDFYRVLECPIGHFRPDSFTCKPCFEDETCDGSEIVVWTGYKFIFANKSLPISLAIVLGGGCLVIFVALAGVMRVLLIRKQKNELAEAQRAGVTAKKVQRPVRG